MTIEKALETVPHALLVVVVGRMNPAIHHPAWYRTIDAITKDEEAAAFKRPVMLTPLGASFQFGNYSIQCDQSRWQVSSSRIDAADRIIDLTCKVFEALMHTPMDAFGFNFLAHMPTNKPQVIEALRTGLGLDRLSEPELKMVGQSLTMKVKVEQGTLATTIEPSLQSEGSVYISINREYVVGQILQSPNFKLFDLTPLIRDNFPKAKELAFNQISKIVSAVDGW